MNTRARPRAGVIAVCVVVVLGLAVVGVTLDQVLTRGHTVKAPPVSAGPHVIWLLTGSAISQLTSSGASHQLISTAFSNSRSYVISNKSPYSIGIPTATYDSYTGIKQAFASRQLPGHYKAVIYDNESWSQTPAAQQRDPARYERLVARLLHAHGLLYIATPAMDLVKVLSPAMATNKASQKSAYLSDSIAGSAARYANIIDIQAQRLQPDTASYASFVKSAAAQARQANPRIIVLAGLRSGQGDSATTLARAYAAVRSVVNGYWLNIPGKSKYCPSCSTPDASPALSFLGHLYRP